MVVVLQVATGLALVLGVVCAFTKTDPWVVLMAILTSVLARTTRVALDAGAEASWWTVLIIASGLLVVAHQAIAAIVARRATSAQGLHTRWVRRFRPR